MVSPEEWPVVCREGNVLLTLVAGLWLIGITAGSSELAVQQAISVTK